LQLGISSKLGYWNLFQGLALNMNYQSGIIFIVLIPQNNQTIASNQQSAISNQQSAISTSFSFNSAYLKLYLLFSGVYHQGFFLRFLFFLLEESRASQRISLSVISDCLP
jgi:hypothetical protein